MPTHWYFEICINIRVCIICFYINCTLAYFAISSMQFIFTDGNVLLCLIISSPSPFQKKAFSWQEGMASNGLFNSAALTRYSQVPAHNLLVLLARLMDYNYTLPGCLAAKINIGRFYLFTNRHKVDSSCMLISTFGCSIYNIDLFFHIASIYVQWNP